MVFLAVAGGDRGSSFYKNQKCQKVEASTFLRDEALARAVVVGGGMVV